MLQKSLSKELLTNVLSVYFLLTFVVTCGQVIAEYVNTKDYIRDELTTLQKTFSRSLTRAIWELNDKQTITTAEGLLAIPMIEGIIVRDDSGEVLSQLGRSLDIHELYSQQLVQEEAIIEDTPSGLFGYTFPLIFEFSGKTTQVGDVTLFSSREVVFSRIMISIYFLIGNAMIKTTFLIILFLLAFRKRLTEPLAQFTEQIEDLELNDLEGRHIEIKTVEHNELKVMEESFNRLIDKVVLYREELEHTQKELLISNEKLDQHNLQLEQEVARKTSNLSQAMMDLQQQKYELEKQKLTLTEEIDLRKQTEQELITKQTELQRYLDELNMAQERLVGSEKMAALGGLVAGITHDVNTPIGIGVTATSFLQERLDQIEAAYKDKTLSPKALEEFINDAKQSTSLLTSNLDRASELVASFKQIAVDQASEAVRTINFKEYFNTDANELEIIKKNSYTFFNKIPIFVARQLVRHRNQLLQELSRRYTNNTTSPVEFYEKDANEEIKSQNISALNTYNSLVDSKEMKPEDARAVLGSGMYTKIWSGWNREGFANFIKLRTKATAQKEIIDLAVACKEFVG